MNKLLIADDESRIREVIKEYAQFFDFEVYQAVDGEDAVTKALSENFDIIVMDIMMPIKDGYTAAKEIREKKDTPIILLSARSEEYDKLYGFEIGIDDYVVKPFSPKELMARINAVITRHKSISDRDQSLRVETSIPASDEIFEIQGLKLDKPSRQVSIDGEKVNLTPKEFDLLCYLIDNTNVALSRETLLGDIWGYEFYEDDRTIDTHIKNLRNHLDKYRDLIVTIRGVGYKFEYED